MIAPCGEAGEEGGGGGANVGAQRHRVRALNAGGKDKKGKCGRIL